MSSNTNQSSFTEHFNDNVEYTKRKTGQGQNQVRDPKTSFRPMHSDIQREDVTGSEFQQQSTASTTTTTTATGSSSQEGGWNRGSRYSFTARDLAHPDEHTSPDE